MVQLVRTKVRLAERVQQRGERMYINPIAVGFFIGFIVGAATIVTIAVLLSKRGKKDD